MKTPPKWKGGYGGLRKFINDELVPWIQGGRVLRSEDVEVDERKDGTRLLTRAGGEPGGQAGVPEPFEGLPADPPDGEASPTEGWIKIALHSMLMRDADPTSKITITGLDFPFALGAGDRVWLEVNLEPMYEEPAGDLTASIEHGADWNPPALAIFPIPSLWDTDDGTAAGSEDDPPITAKPIRAYVPIGYVAPIAGDPFELAGEGVGLALFDGHRFIQQLSTHLMMGRICVDNAEVPYPVPFHAPQPEV